MDTRTRQVRDRRLGPLWFPADDEVIAPVVERQGIWEPNEGRWLDLVLRPGMTVVNAGANVGYFTLWAAQRVGPTGTVTAIEPHPDNVEILRRNVADRDLSQVRTVAAAASAVPGSLELFVNDHNTGDHRVFDPQAARSADPELAAASGGFTTDVRRIEVPAVTVDELMGDVDVDVIFTDTQGHDHEVLAGAQQVLARCRPLVMTEFVPAWIRAQRADPRQVLRDWMEQGYRIGVWDAGRAPGEWDPDRIVAYAETPGRWFTNLELWPQERPLIPRLTPAEGFWGVELVQESQLNWLTEPQGVLRAVGAPGTADMVVDLVAPPGGHVKVELGGRRVTVRGTKRLQLPIELDAAGTAQVVVSVAGDPRSVPGDPRPLFVGVRDPSLIPT